MTPLVSAAPLNEWPEPATFSGRPCSVAAITSAISPSRVRGRWISSGRQRCSPDQFLHRLRNSSATAANPSDDGAPFCPRVGDNQVRHRAEPGGVAERLNAPGSKTGGR